MATRVARAANSAHVAQRLPRDVARPGRGAALPDSREPPQDRPAKCRPAHRPRRPAPLPRARRLASARARPAPRRSRRGPERGRRDGPARRVGEEHLSRRSRETRCRTWPPTVRSSSVSSTTSSPTRSSSRRTAARVRLAARHEGDSAVLEVSDTGLGIPHAEQSDLFNRFFRGTNAIEKAIPGSGLGLRDLPGHRRSPRRHDPARQHPRRRLDLPPRAPARLNREAVGLDVGLPGVTSRTIANDCHSGESECPNEDLRTSRLRRVRRAGDGRRLRHVGKGAAATHAALRARSRRRGGSDPRPRRPGRGSRRSLRRPHVVTRYAPPRRDRQRAGRRCARNEALRDRRLPRRDEPTHRRRRGLRPLRSHLVGRPAASRPRRRRGRSGARRPHPRSRRRQQCLDGSDALRARPEHRPMDDRGAAPAAEGSPAAVVRGGKIYAVGGRSGFSDFGNTYIYDPAADAWTRGPSIPPRGTAGAAVWRIDLPLRRRVPVRAVGARRRLPPCPPGARAWHRIGRLPTPRNYARAVVFRRRIYVVGGSKSAGDSHAARGSRVVEWLAPR